MPELPEVETIRRGLSELIVGRKILGLTTDTPKMIQPSLATVKKEVIGKTIKEIDRRAKLLQIKFANDKALAIHLKMTGRLLVRKKGAKKDDWQHVVISLSGGKELRFADLRKFGWIKLVDKKQLEKIISEFGPEPEELTAQKFKDIITASRRPIKIQLMDQKKLSGVGNIYAADALNIAKINPRRAANSLSEKETEALLGAVKKVLKAGIRYRGASDNAYLDALGHKGHYQEHFLVYNREGKPCFNPACRQAGVKIKKIKLAGRGTYFCPNCQK